MNATEIQQIEEMLAKVAAIKGWYLDEMDAVRIKSPSGECQCPLTALASQATGREIPITAYKHVFGSLNIGERAATAISDAADGQFSAWPLRARLFAACGLS